MVRHAILHIGPMKTGSTSIQLWLDKGAAELREAGFHFPASLGGRNMSNLAYMAQAVAQGRPIPAPEAARLEALKRELAALDPKVERIVFSGEMLGQSLTDPAEVEALKAILDPMFGSYTVIVYLRRQDEMSLSRYSTALRRGQTRVKPLSNPVNYELLLDNWSRVFGRASVRPRMFDRAAMVGGDVVRDFADAAGIPYFEAEVPTDANPSLSLEAQAFLIELADRAREAGHEGPFVDVTGYQAISRVLNSEFAGKGMRPARDEAIAFYAQVRESNERVRRAWFPDRPKLFPEDFSKYPEVADAPPPPEQLLDVAMTVLTEIAVSPPQDRMKPKLDREVKQDMRREKRQRRVEGGPPRRGRRNRD